MDACNAMATPCGDCLDSLQLCMCSAKSGSRRYLHGRRCWEACAGAGLCRSCCSSLLCYPARPWLGCDLHGAAGRSIEAARSARWSRRIVICSGATMENSPGRSAAALRACLAAYGHVLVPCDAIRCRSAHRDHPRCNPWKHCLGTDLWSRRLSVASHIGGSLWWRRCCSCRRNKPHAARLHERLYICCRLHGHFPDCCIRHSSRSLGASSHGRD
mmetsp:Transcript_18294/g.42715  ORF Transcript_18294/g.42715 Transcript_18294/m.42715 type:complete len:215 (+) Transcript_18294:831-1475(+)